MFIPKKVPTFCTQVWYCSSCRRPVNCESKSVRMNTHERTCISCSKTLKGRLDKRFCDDYCRNQFHNAIKSPENNLVRNVNNALTKNRRILKNTFKSTPPPHQVHVEDLMQEGYVFRYHTHFLNEATQGYACYDYGVLLQPSGFCTIVQCEGNQVKKEKIAQVIKRYG